MTRVEVRAYESADEQSWLRCRVLSFLDTQYYDDVKPRRTELAAGSIALVAVVDGAVAGILDIEIDADAATIDTVAVHPDHRGAGIATALLDAALPRMTERGVRTLDAWTREDAAANRWYRRSGFEERFRYLHVYLGPDEDAEGFATPEGLSSPVAAFSHARLEDEETLRERFARVYACRRYVRELAP